MRLSNDTLVFDYTDLAQPTCTSQAMPLHNISQYAVQIVTTGAPAGTFKIQVSCDKGTTNSGQPDVTAVTNWSDLPSATMAVSGAGISFINLVDAGYFWFRVIYTKTSGTGAISSAKFSAKGI